MSATERESEVVRRLATHGCLSFPQLRAFLFDGARVGERSKDVLTWRVLRRLTASGLIAATPRRIGGPGGGSARRAYFLTDAGARLVGAVSPRRLLRPGRGSFLLAHDLMTAEVALAFRGAARSHAGHQFVDWEPGSQAAERLGASLVVPDAHLVYATEAWRLDAFIEVDLATEGTRFYAAKIRRYLDLYRTGGWRAHLPTWPVVLTVTPTTDRANALRVATEIVLGSRQDGERLARATKFAFASLDALLGRGGPLGEIWQVAGRPSREALTP